MVPPVSLRTLALTLELLMAVVALQHLAAIRATQAGAAWLANDRLTTVSGPAEAVRTP